MITHKIFKSEEEMNIFLSKPRLNTFRVINIETINVVRTKPDIFAGFIGTDNISTQELKMWYDNDYIK
jgi:hypothetical protein